MYEPDVAAPVPLDNTSERQNDAEHLKGPLNDFRFWWDLGYRSLVPIVPPGVDLSPKSQLAKKLEGGRDDRGKAPGTQRPDGRWTGLYGWQTHETTEADLDRWAEMGAGVGLADDGGLVILDIDAQDEATADSIEAEALEILGPAPCRVGAWPKRLLVYRIEQTLPFMLVTFKGPGAKPDRVEVLAKPKQAVVAGTHSGTGKPYEWRRPPVAREQLTLVMRQQVDTFFARLANRLSAAITEKGATLTDREAVDQAKLKGDIALVRKAVAAIPNTAALFPSYDSMVEIGEAIHGACIDDDEAGREIWHEWASRWEGGDYKFDVSEACWETFRAPHAIGAAYLYRLAEQHSGGVFTKSDIHYDEAALESFTPPEGVTAAPKPPKFSLQPFDAVAASALSVSSKPLVDGLLDQGAMSVLYGASNTGKTFVAMDLGYHVAAGTPWGGMRTEQLAVVYIAAEGGVGARRRAAALASKYGPCASFFYVLSPVNLLDRTADLVPLVETLRQVDRLGLVVIDTLSRVLAGGEENSSVDMGALVANFDAIRDATGAHVMVVHHTGKIEARGARGHSLLRAATDTEIEISEEGIRVTKQRDMDKCAASEFRLEVVPLGVDASSRPVSSCTVRLIRPGSVETGTPTPRQAEVQRALEIALAEAPDPTKGVRLTAIAAVLGEDSEKGKEQVRNALGGLVSKNLALSVKRGAWIVRDIHAAACFQEIDPPAEAPRKLGNRVATDDPEKGRPYATLLAPSVGVFG